MRPAETEAWTEVSHHRFRLLEYAIDWGRLWVCAFDVQAYGATPGKRRQGDTRHRSPGLR